MCMCVCTYLSSKHFPEMFHGGWFASTWTPCQCDPSYIQVCSLGCLPYIYVYVYVYVYVYACVCIYIYIHLLQMKIYEDDMCAHACLHTLITHNITQHSHCAHARTHTHTHTHNTHTQTHTTHTHAHAHAHICIRWFGPTVRLWFSWEMLAVV